MAARVAAQPTTERITKEVPDLRIVDDALWQRVKARQGEIARSARVQGSKASRFWKKRGVHLPSPQSTCAGGNPGADQARDAGDRV
jgi:site-specific DNA recombinase